MKFSPWTGLIFCLKCIAPYGLHRYGSVQCVEENKKFLFCRICTRFQKVTAWNSFSTSYNCFLEESRSLPCGCIHFRTVFFFLKIWSGFFFLQLSGSAHFIVITTITNTMQCGNRRILLIVQFFLFYDTFITIFPIYFFLSIPNFALPERCDCLLCQSILHKIINWYIIIFCRKIVLLPARRGLIFCHDISSFWIEISLFFCFFLTTKF